jgi:hypothetical protein
MGKHKGIKLVAYLAVSKTTVLDVGTQHDQGGALFLDELPRSFILRQGYFDPMHNPFDVDFNVSGNGFKYEALLPGLPKVPVAGTIKGIDVFVGGSLALQLSKLDLSASKAFKLWNNKGPFDSIETLLEGDDTIIGSDFPDPNLWGGKGNDLMWGRGGGDIVDGFKGDDINDGGLGNDYLIDTKGNDRFQFSTELGLTAALNLNSNYDTIKKFGKGDEIYLKTGVFLDIGSSLSKAEFHYGNTATTPEQRILFDGTIGYWDRDGNGTAYEAIPFFGVESGGGNFNYKSFVMGAMYDTGY